MLGGDEDLEGAVAVEVGAQQLGDGDRRRRPQAGGHLGRSLLVDGRLGVPDVDRAGRVGHAGHRDRRRPVAVLEVDGDVVRRLLRRAVLGDGHAAAVRVASSTPTTV